ncbi:hypothetical protein FRC12_007988 [Ceratobasidium sp. 428]|nr:hypothetical protein FRC12_007988 [Ceratobasidium sp. 428]
MLPPELLQDIINHLWEDAQTLSTICLSDKLMHAIATPLLYHHVTLGHPAIVLSFRQALSMTQHPLGHFVCLLRIGTDQRPPDGRMHRYMVPALRDILCRMPNLRELFLAATFTTVNLCLNDLKAPFSLERLVCPCVASGAFWSFLRSQPSITAIEFFAYECNPDKFVRSVPEDILPNLNTFRGSLDALTAFSRLGPVSNFTITGWGAYYSFRDLALLVTGTPVQSIICHDFHPHEDTKLDSVLRNSAYGTLAKSLKILTVVDRCMPGSSLKDTPVARYCLDRLSNFRALEEFKIVRDDEVVAENESTQNTSEWLGDWATQDTWRHVCPSLRTVKVYEENVLSAT